MAYPFKNARWLSLLCPVCAVTFPAFPPVPCCKFSQPRRVAGGEAESPAGSRPPSSLPLRGVARLVSRRTGVRLSVHSLILFEEPTDSGRHRVLDHVAYGSPLHRGFTARLVLSWLCAGCWLSSERDACRLWPRSSQGTGGDTSKLQINRAVANGD